MKKAQAALEFLTTYAWAFVVIAITLAALYYSGLFDFSRYIPQKCSFPLQFKCNDFALRPSEVRIKLVNNLGEDIKVNEIYITSESDPPLGCAVPSVPYDWPHSNETEFTFTGCSGGDYVRGERVDVRITMKYFAVKTPSKPIHTIVGKINGEVN